MSDGIGSIAYNGPNVAGSGGGSLPGVTQPLISFAVGDGQAGSPADGDTFIKLVTMQGQNIVDKQLYVEREGIGLLYSSPVQVNDIRRFNSGGLGGFVFEAASGLFFSAGERYNIYITGVNGLTAI